MDGYRKVPLAPGSAAGIHSAAAKLGGADFVIVVILLFIIYMTLRRGCAMNFKVNGDEAPRREAEEV